MNNAQKKYVEKHGGYNTPMLRAKSSRGIVLEFDDKNALIVKDYIIAPEKYIVAKDYNKQTGEWYGGGEYFNDLEDAVKRFKELSKKQAE